MVLQPVTRACKLLGVYEWPQRLVAGQLSAMAGSGELLPLPDIRSENVIIVGDAIGTKEALQVFLILGQRMCRVEEEMGSQDREQMSPNNE